MKNENKTYGTFAVKPDARFDCAGPMLGYCADTLAHVPSQEDWNWNAQEVSIGLGACLFTFEK